MKKNEAPRSGRGFYSDGTLRVNRLRYRKPFDFERVAVLIFLGACLELGAAEPVVSNVRAAQRPGRMLVEITYDVDHAGKNNLNVSLALSEDGGETYAELTEGLTGDCGSGVVPGKDKRVVWKPDVSWLGRKLDRLKFRVTATAKTANVSGTWTTRSRDGREGPKIQVLLVTGNDVGVHPWYEVSQAIREALLAANKFEVKVCEDPGVLESAATLRRYDVIFLHFYNAKLPTLSDTAKENLLTYVKGGKGFCVSHLSSASFKEWTEFQKLCGRYWVMGKSGHGPRSTFKAKIADKNHPITKGLEDFEADDELYAKLQGDTPVHALVMADSDWSRTTEALAFVLDYGKGRVFHETFGHDGKAIKNPAVTKLIQRGTEWAATGKVE